MPIIVLGCFLVHGWCCKGINHCWLWRDICSFRHPWFYLFHQIGNAQNWLKWATPCLRSSAAVKSSTIASNSLKKNQMYPLVSLCLDVACQLQGLGLLFLLQAEHVRQFLDMITLSKCLLSMICKCVLPYVEELGGLSNLTCFWNCLRMARVW